MHRSLLIVVCLQLGAVVSGQGIGFAFPVRSSSVYGAWAAIAGLLLVSGIVDSLVRNPETRGPRTVASMASLAYSFGIVLGEPFWRMQNNEEIAVAVVLLLPLLLAIGYLGRSEEWVSVAGVTLFVLTSNVMIASNANSSVSGAGFFREWVS